MSSDVAPRKQRDGLLHRMIDHRVEYLYVLPALLVMMVVIAYPIYYTIDLSFYRTPANLQMKDKVFDGLNNYSTILASDSFRAVTINTLIWTVASTGIAFVLGLLAALALHEEFRGRGVLRAVLLVPYVVSAVAASYVWKWLYHSDFGVIRRVVGATWLYRQADQLSRQHPYRSAFADRGADLAGVFVRHDHADGRAANRARQPAPRRTG